MQVVLGLLVVVVGLLVAEVGERIWRWGRIIEVHEALWRDRLVVERGSHQLLELLRVRCALHQLLCLDCLRGHEHLWLLNLSEGSYLSEFLSYLRLLLQRR